MRRSNDTSGAWRWRRALACEQATEPPSVRPKPEDDTLRRIAFLFIVAVSAACLSSCGAKKLLISGNGDSEDIPVTLPGTGDSQDLLRGLARSYIAQYPNRAVIVPDSVGSGGGIKAVGTGDAPIGRVARLPHPEEEAKYGEFRYLEFARVPVAFVVSPNAGVSNLGEREICDIYRGRITNWKEVGGNDLFIDVQARPNPGSNM